jgi:HEAT repeat protein
VPKLRGYLTSGAEDAYVRKESALALSDIGDLTAVDTFGEVLATAGDEDERVKLGVIEASKRMVQHRGAIPLLAEKVLPPLRQIVETSSPRSRLHILARQALVQIEAATTQPGMKRLETPRELPTIKKPK